ncbi:CBS domain-containing protein [Nocardioidaceae bacterium]|nr:CBS domain-containing protein [Nocardioidaceae bacterium]
MSTSPHRVFVARLAGLPVFDPNGDQVGKVRDAVVFLRHGVQQPRVVGLVVEVFGRRSIFVPMTRVTGLESGQVLTTGLVNMRRFAQRSAETLAIGQMLDRHVSVRDPERDSDEPPITGTVYDLGMEQARNRDWVITKVALTQGAKRFGRRGQTHVVDWRDVEGFETLQPQQGAERLVASLSEMKPADAAQVLRELPADRRGQVVAVLDDELLADLLEELPDEDQVSIVGSLDSERAADVLEEMSADDAADLIADLPPEVAATLLELMEPEDAEDVKRLMSYDDLTAGGMMTPEPVILPPDATVAEALAHVRNPDLTPSLGALVYVCRSPYEPPTGRYVGLAHIQKLLREPPSTLVAGCIDSGTDPIRPEAGLEEVAAHMAAYNLVACPVVDADQRLLGVVTVDDLLDHMLPRNWRDRGAPGNRLSAAASRRRAAASSSVPDLAGGPSRG